jgi:hypothetical protein
MDRLDLIPAPHRAERLLIVDLLAGRNVPFDVDAEAFLAVAPKKLHPYLFLRLRNNARAAAVHAPLLDAYRRHALRELRRGAELRRIDGALRGAGVRFLVLKGPVLAASVYPDRASRTMTDLDFLISEEELPRAMEAMHTAGYFVPERFLGATMEPGDSPPMIHEEPGGPSIELHTMLDSLPNERAALEAVIARARQVDVGHGLSLPALDRGEFFAHVAIHVSKHHRFEGELRSLLDVALLLRHDGDLEWSTLLAEWDRRGIAEWIALTVTLAHVLLDAPLPPAIAERRVADDALRIAAELLWIEAKTDVPQRVTFALAGHDTATMHEGVGRHTVRMPRGIRSIPARAARQLDRLQRVVAAVARPRKVAAAVDLHRKREQLFGIVEKRSVRD